MRALLLLGLVACGGEEGDLQGEPASDARHYAPPAGMELELIPDGAADGRPLWLRARSDEWEAREGWSWAGAEVLGRWSVEAKGDLVVDGAVLLPAAISDQASFAGGRVSAVGSSEVWYGTFADTVTVELTGGPLPGVVVFARGVGPIAFDLAGESWELAGYDPN